MDALLDVWWVDEREASMVEHLAVEKDDLLDIVMVAL